MIDCVTFCHEYDTKALSDRDRIERVLNVVEATSREFPGPRGMQITISDTDEGWRLAFALQIAGWHIVSISKDMVTHRIALSMMNVDEGENSEEGRRCKGYGGVGCVASKKVEVVG